MTTYLITVIIAISCAGRHVHCLAAALSGTVSTDTQEGATKTGKNAKQKEEIK